MIYIFISAFCFCVPCRVEICSLTLYTEVLSSDNSIVCFRHKAFLKSDMLAGFTTREALIWYLTCVISLDVYSNLFEFGALRSAFSLAFGQVGG